MLLNIELVFFVFFFCNFASVTVHSCFYFSSHAVCAHVYWTWTVHDSKAVLVGSSHWIIASESSLNFQSLLQKETDIPPYAESSKFSVHRGITRASCSICPILRPRNSLVQGKLLYQSARAPWRGLVDKFLWKYSCFLNSKWLVK